LIHISSCSLRSGDSLCCGLSAAISFCFLFVRLVFLFVFGYLIFHPLVVWLCWSFCLLFVLCWYFALLLDLINRKTNQQTSNLFCYQTCIQRLVVVQLPSSQRFILSSTYVTLSLVLVLLSSYLVLLLSYLLIQAFVVFVCCYLVAALSALIHCCFTQWRFAPFPDNTKMDAKY